MLIGIFPYIFFPPTRHKPNAGICLIDHCTQHTVGSQYMLCQVKSQVSLLPSDLSLIAINKHSWHLSLGIQVSAQTLLLSDPWSSHLHFQSLDVEASILSPSWCTALAAILFIYVLSPHPHREFHWNQGLIHCGIVRPVSGSQECSAHICWMKEWMNQKAQSCGLSCA